MDWRIYGVDGDGQWWQFDSSMGGPADVPWLGAQLVVQKDASVGRNLRWDHYYWFTRGEWFAGNEGGLLAFLYRAGIYQRSKGLIHYWQHDGKDHHGDILTLLSFMAQKGLVKLGEYIPTEEFNRIYQKAAFDDPDFPQKSGRHWLEEAPPYG